MIKKLLAVLGLAFVALLAAPSASFAYAPDGDGVGSVTGRPVPGAGVSVGFPEAFTPGEKVQIVVACPGAANMVLDDVADGNGSTDTPFSVPTSATGTCTITAHGVSSGSAATAAFAVLAADPGASEPGSGLAVTGVSPVVAVWLGVGALAVGAVLLRVRSVRRTAGR